LKISPPCCFGHKLRTKHTLILNIIFASKIKDMPYEEVYFQRLKEDNPEEFKKSSSLKNN
jgi:hypothetical protein